MSVEFSDVQTTTEYVDIYDKSGNVVACEKTLEENGVSITLVPSEPLIAGEQYTVKITDKNIAGCKYFDIYVFDEEIIEVTINDEGFSCSSTAEISDSGSYYKLSKIKNDWAQYKPILSGGMYEIYAYVPMNNSISLSKTVNVAITCQIGTSSVTYNSYQVPLGWLKLEGQYNFASGNVGYVKVTNGEHWRTAGVSSMKFVKVGEN